MVGSLEDIHGDRDTYSLDLEASCNEFNSPFLTCILDIAVVEVDVETCIACTDYLVAYCFEQIEDDYYLVDMEALAYLDCSDFDWDACRALDRGRVDTLGDIDPFAYALDGVDTYMAGNKKLADSLDFYYYLG